MVRPMWILAFSLALVCTASAVPCRDDSCGKKDQEEGRKASSIQLKAKQPGDRSYGASPILIEDLRPEPSTKDQFPPGLLEGGERDALPPGLRDDGLAHEWRKRIAIVPVLPAQDPGSGSPPIPQRTYLTAHRADATEHGAHGADQETHRTRVHESSPSSRVLRGVDDWGGSCIAVAWRMIGDHGRSNARNDRNQPGSTVDSGATAHTPWADSTGLVSASIGCRA
jgi:hypothetical protein